MRVGWSGADRAPPRNDAMAVAWIGILVAGILGGAFVAPAGRLRKLRWDQAWLIFCFVGLVVLPVLLAWFFARPVFRVDFVENPRDTAIVAGCGALWGLGAFLFGMLVPRIGIALANAIVNGVVVLIGSISPLLIGAARISPGERAGLAVGLGLLLVGISFCGWASILRDRDIGAASSVKRSTTASVWGVGLAVVAGAISALINTGFAYGGPLIGRTSEAGIAAVPASLAVWLPLFCAGFLVNLAAVGWKLSRSGGWSNFAEATGGDWWRAAQMGVYFFASFLIYGVCAARLGDSGSVYGWAVNCGMAILASTALGFAVGEWRQAGRASRRWVLAGVVAFLAALPVLAINGVS